ncbi:MAG: cation-transporting P-type ATPase, partial [Xanthomonadales bacterium]|nr:cation-transporting P-type ATPase [Xanthomonadales bacterium]
MTLAIGVGRMAKRRAIIRRLAAVETLGSTTVICSDKTGTLTENAMTVRAIYCGGRRFTVAGHGYNPEGDIRHDELAVAADGALRECLVAGALCNDASLARTARHWAITGDPTEAALLVVARKGGLDENTLHKLFPRQDELPFDASRQYMATAHASDGGQLIYVKGALERLLPRCVEQLSTTGQNQALDPEALEAAAEAFAGQGMRVLLLARRVAPPGSALSDDGLHGLCLIGIVGMIDPPRKA